MKATGRRVLLAVCCGLWLCASPVLAAVNASLDRTLGELRRLNTANFDSSTQG